MNKTNFFCLYFSRILQQILDSCFWVPKVFFYFLMYFVHNGRYASSLLTLTLTSFLMNSLELSFLLTFVALPRMSWWWSPSVVMTFLDSASRNAARATVIMNYVTFTFFKLKCIFHFFQLLPFSLHLIEPLFIVITVTQWPCGDLF